MSEWRSCKLSDVADVIDSMHQTPKYSALGRPLVRVTDLKNGYLSLKDCLQVTEEVYQTYSSRHKSQEGDIVFARVGSYGNLGFVNKPMDFCLGQNTAFIIPKEDARYLYYYLKSPLGQNEIEASVGGSTQPTVSIKSIKNFEVLTPPLPEQKAIASVLSSLDDKIDLLHRQNKTLEAMAETLFRHWFMEEAKEDWEEVPLSDYFKVKHGYAFKGEFITPEPTKYRLVTPGNFEIGGGFKSAKFKYYSSDVIPEDYVFNELDFVVTMTDLSKEGDTLGYPAFIPLHHKADGLYLHNQRVGKVQFYDEKECKFFFYMLMKQDVYQQFIVGSCTGTSVKHTSPTMIGSFTFAKPPQEKMHDFDRIVGQKFAKIFVNQKQIQILENLRDTLLPKLMSGEVRVEYQTKEVA